MNFPVVHPHANDGFYFFFHQVPGSMNNHFPYQHHPGSRMTGFVILSSAYQVQFTLVALLSLINSTPLTVLTYSIRCSSASKALDRFSDFFFSDANGRRCNPCCHGIVLIVYSLQCKIINAHLHLLVFLPGLVICPFLINPPWFSSLLHGKW